MYCSIAFDRKLLVVPIFLPIAQPSNSPKEALPEQSVDVAHGRQKADHDKRPCPGFLQTCYKPRPKSTEFPPPAAATSPLFPQPSTLVPVSFTSSSVPNKGSCSNLENMGTIAQLSSEHGTSTTTVQRFGQGL